MYANLTLPGKSSYKKSSSWTICFLVAFGKVIPYQNQSLFNQSHRGSGMVVNKRAFNNPSWWFQPIWKILVKLDHFPK